MAGSGIVVRLGMYQNAGCVVEILDGGSLLLLDVGHWGSGGWGQITGHIRVAPIKFTSKCTLHIMRI